MKYNLAFTIPDYLLCLTGIKVNLFKRCLRLIVVSTALVVGCTFAIPARAAGFITGIEYMFPVGKGSIYINGIESGCAFAPRIPPADLSEPNLRSESTLKQDVLGGFVGCSTKKAVESGLEVAQITLGALSLACAAYATPQTLTASVVLGSSSLSLSILSLVLKNVPCQDLKEDQKMKESMCNLMRANGYICDQNSVFLERRK